MRVVKWVVGKSVPVGGEEHSGWLPPGASQPPPIPKDRALVDVRILEDVQGFILEFEFQNSSSGSDSWHSTIEEAENEAETRFGISPSDWNTLPNADS